VTVTCAATDRSHNLWLGATSGLIRLDRSFEIERDSYGLVAATEEGVWAAIHNQGLDLWQDQGWQAALRRPLFGYIPCLRSDEQGRVWGARFAEGISQGFWWFDPKVGTATYCRVKPTDPEWQDLWVLSPGGQVLRQEVIKRRLTSPDVQDLAVNGPKEIAYLATDKGLNVYHIGRKEWEAYHTRDGLAQENITALALDRRGYLWCGHRGQVSRFEGRRFQVFGLAEGFPGGTVTCLGVDRNGHLWAGTERGLGRYDGRRWQRYTTAEGLPGDYVSCLTVTDRGLWIGTDRGLVRASGEGSPTFRSHRPPLDPNVLSIAARQAAGQTEIWFTTRAGIFRYRPEAKPPDTKITFPQAHEKLTCSEVTARFSGTDLGTRTEELQ
jgi:ligand-binding sensor domain-containing protein